MIGRPTALVLGAGASADYGFPTGRQLVRDICSPKGLDGLLGLFLINEMKVGREELEDFQGNLEYSNTPSVDLFLEHRPDYEKIGKLAIAASLIPHESLAEIAPSETQRWYEMLFGLMVEGGPFEKNPLSIITFNYDRSLETFLLWSVINFYGCKADEAEALLSQIRIVHPYGSLGKSLTFAYSPPESACQPNLVATVQAAADNIKIMHEAGERAEFGAVHKLLFDAEEIIFLGFGFHAMNMNRLNLQGVLNWKHEQRKSAIVRACRTGMGDGDVARAIAHSGTREIMFAPKEGWNILDFLKNTPCLIP